MWVFWIITAALAAGAAILVLARAAGAARAAASQAEDPALAIYRRQLSELDELAAGGLLGPEERRAAEAEAGRRLLSAADAPRRREAPGDKFGRRVATLGAAGAAVTALLLYLALGSPGLPDQPYRARVKAWRAADPATLTPDRMAAVLRAIAAERPHDPQVYEYLGRADLAAGNAFAAGRAFEKAAALAPARSDLLTAEGEAMVAEADGEVTPDAQAVFRRALERDPKDPAARFFLGRAMLAAGDKAGALADWRALAGDLAPDDPRRPALLADIASAGGTAPVPAPPSSPVAGADQMAFIRAMVAREAAALQAHPDDPAGWARLLRSYAVLGDPAGEANALARIRQVFAGRPEVVSQIVAQAKSGPVAAPAGAP